MATFKINKDLNKSPLIWGLKVPLFGAFLGVIAINTVTLISGLSFRKIFIAILICAISYLLCLVLSRLNMARILFSDSYPKSVKNNLDG